MNDNPVATTDSVDLGPPDMNALVPRNMDQAIRLAEFMARAGMVPDHLKKDPGTCLMLVEQAMRWRMSPFAVAQGTSNIRGKLMFSGVLTAAAVEASGAIVGGFDYQFSGDEGTDKREVIVSATRRGEKQKRSVLVKFKDVRTDNPMWIKQPDQQLIYSGSRIWARRWTPSVLLGVYTPEEFDQQEAITEQFMGPTIEGKASESTTAATDPAKPPKEYPDTWLGLVGRELDAAKNDQRWARVLVAAYQRAPDEASVFALRYTYGEALKAKPAKVQSQVQAASGEADQRIADLPRFCVIGPDGDVRAEFTNAVDFASKLVETWGMAALEDGAKILENSAADIDVARQTPDAAAILECIDEPPLKDDPDEAWLAALPTTLASARTQAAVLAVSDLEGKRMERLRKTKPDIFAAAKRAFSKRYQEVSPPKDAPTFRAIDPPIENDRPAWEKWAVLVRDEIPRIRPDLLVAWAEVQQPAFESAPEMEQKAVMDYIRAALEHNGIALPEWLTKGDD